MGAKKFFTTKKIVLFSIIVAVLVFLFGLLPFSFGSIAKYEIERFGTKSFKANLRLGQVYVSILSGTLVSTSLEIDNPDGFGSGFAIKSGTVTAQANPFSLLRDVTTVNSMVVHSPLINYIKGGGTSNIEKLSANMSSSPHKDEYLNKKKFIIKELVLKNPRVIWHPPIIHTPATFSLPDIRIANIGAGGGINTSEIMTLVLERMIPPVNKALEGEMEKIGSAGKGAIDKVKDKVKGLLNQ